MNLWLQVRDTLYSCIVHFKYVYIVDITCIHTYNIISMYAPMHAYTIYYIIYTNRHVCVYAYRDLRWLRTFNWASKVDFSPDRPVGSMTNITAI